MKYTPDFSSRFRILKGGKISLVVSALIAGSTMSFASPTGGQVTTGSATINQSGSVTTINQSTNKASINWNSFSIAPSETVNFVQPSAQSVTLNRVVGTTQSLIQGAMNANGQVFLINPNGVLFANGSQINVGGLVASTLNITDANFQAGNYVFEGNSQNSIINMGTITTAQGGYVAMMGKHVANEGTIVATMGNIQMASGEKISLNLNGNSLMKLTIDQGTLNALVENKGLIKADGGQVYLTTQALNTILDGMVNNTGVIEAQTLNDVTGHIELFAHGGTANVGGTLDASAPNGGDGGFIETSGKVVNITNSASITASSQYGKGGEWLLDPYNVFIQSGIAQDGSWSGSGSTDSFTPNTDDSVIGADRILSILDGGTSVTITTDGAGTQAGDITINSNIDYTGVSDVTLTFKAQNNILVNSNRRIASTGGKLNVVLWSDSDSSGSGAIWLGDFSNIATNGGHVWMGGGSGTVNNWNGYGFNVGSGAAISDDNFNGVEIKGTINTSDGSGDFNNYGSISIKGMSNSSSAKKAVWLYNGAELIGSNVIITGDSTTGDGILVDDARIDSNALTVNSSAGGTDGRGFASTFEDNVFTARTGGIMFNNYSSAVNGTGISAIGTFNSEGGIYFIGVSSGGKGFEGGYNGNLTINDTMNGGQIWIYGLSLGGDNAGVYIADGYSVNVSTLPTGTLSLIGNGYGNGAGVEVANSNANFTTGNATAINESFQSVSRTGLWIKGTGGDAGAGVNLKGNYYAINGDVSVTGIGGANGADDAGHGIVLGYGTLGHQAYDGKDTLNVILEGTAQGGNNSGIYFDQTDAMKITTLNNGYVKMLGHGYGSGYGVDINNAAVSIYGGSGTIFSMTQSLYMNAVGGDTGSGARIAGNIESQGDVLLTGSVGSGSTGSVLSGLEIVGGSLYTDGELSIIGNGQSAAGDAHGVVLNGATVTSDTDMVTLTGMGHGNGYGINFKDSGSSISANNGMITLSGSGQTGTVNTIYQDANAPVELSADTSILLKGNGGSIWLGHENNDIDSQYGVAANQGTKTVDFTLVSGNNDLKLGRIDTTGKINIYTVNEGPITLRSDITTTSTSDDAIVINAGRTISAGSITNPSGDEVNIVVENGSPVDITAGSGGTVKLYTGSIANSIGIGEMATSSDYKQYNSDKDTDLSDYMNDFGAGRYVIYREASSGSNGGTPGGGSTPPPTPTVPTQSVVQNQVNNVVTTIVNSTIVTPPAPFTPRPNIAQTQTNQLLQNILPQGNGGEIYNLVGTTDGNAAVETVSMEQLQKASSAQAVNEIRVALGQDSFVELVNGGVHLPNGVSQEFYIVNNTNSEKKN